MLEELGGISISSRHLNNLTVKVGTELAEDRDARTAAYFNQPLPRTPRRPEVPIALAAVSIDGGRMQTRLDGGGVGVHNPHWRETKNALFLRMNGVSFAEDPHPELPECFVDPHRMKTLLPGVASGQSDRRDDRQTAPETQHGHYGWRPEPLFRTCLSSLTTSDMFGRMMAAEADLRGSTRPQSERLSATACRTTGQFNRSTFEVSRPSLILFTQWNMFTQRHVVYEMTRRNSGGFISNGPRRVGKVVCGKSSHSCVPNSSVSANRPLTPPRMILARSLATQSATSRTTPNG